MIDYKRYFKGKRVTVMGLGLLGRGVGDALFLAECEADLTVTDLRDSKTLAPSLAKLKKYKHIRYTLGEHKLEDFRNRPKPSGDGRGPDFILKAAGVPLDSPYIAEARKHDIPIEMDASLFAKFAPEGVTLVGVTGTRGKSTVTELIHQILNSSFSKACPPIGRRGGAEPACRAVFGAGRSARRRIFKGGNLVPEATLPLLKKVRAGDIVVLELDSWQLQGFHDSGISPQIAVFTTFLDDHLNYYKGDNERYFEDKIAIFRYQKQGDVLIAGEQAATLIGKSAVPVSGDFIVAKREDVPAGWKIQLIGEHNLENVACALKVAEHFKIPKDVIRKAVENFKGIPGRLEYLRSIRGVKIYNDNNATTPDATIAALRALSSSPSAPFQRGSAESALCPVPSFALVLGRRRGSVRRVVLIMGGTNKGLDMSKLVKEIPKHCKAVILLSESGTEKLLSEFPLNKGGAVPHFAAKWGTGDVIVRGSLKECVKQAMKIATKGDIVLFSPAFASFGKWFKNEYDRGNQFVELIRKL